MTEVFFQSENSDVFGIEIQKGNQKDIVVTGYCPPAENSQDKNLQRVEKFYESVYLAIKDAKTRDHKNIHVIADFNVRLPGTGDHNTHKENRKTRIRIENLIKDFQLTNMNIQKQQGKYTFIKRDRLRRKYCCSRQTPVGYKNSKLEQTSTAAVIMYL